MYALSITTASISRSTLTGSSDSTTATDLISAPAVVAPTTTVVAATRVAEIG
jgi:hypothetical protein